MLARIGEGRARGVFISGRVFDAAEAVALGLVTRAVPAEALDAAVEAEIAPYFAAAPAAVAAAKRLARSLGPRIDAGVIEATIARLADAWETPEAREGITAFLEKRPAAWGALSGGAGPVGDRPSRPDQRCRRPLRTASRRCRALEADVAQHLVAHVGEATAARSAGRGGSRSRARAKEKAVMGVLRQSADGVRAPGRYDASAPDSLVSGARQAPDSVLSGG